MIRTKAPITNSSFTEEDWLTIAAMSPESRARFWEVVARGGVMGGEDDDEEDGDDDDEAVTADDATGDDDGKKGKAGSGDDSATKELAATKARLAELEDADKKRQDRARKKKEQEAVEKGDAKRVIEEKDAELSAAQERIAALEARFTESAEANFKKLPKEDQEEVAKFKDDLSAEKYAALVETVLRRSSGDSSDENVQTEEKKPNPPSTGSAVKAKKNKDEYEPLERTVEIIEDELMSEGDPIGTLKGLNVIKKPNGNNITRFPGKFNGAKEMIKRIKKSYDPSNEFILKTGQRRD